MNYLFFVPFARYFSVSLSFSLFSLSPVLPFSGFSLSQLLSHFSVQLELLYILVFLIEVKAHSKSSASDATLHQKEAGYLVKEVEIRDHIQKAKKKEWKA